MTFIPVAEYSPDMPDYQNPGSSNIRNCVPRTTQSYGPFPTLSPYGTALAKFCQGAYSCLDASDNVYVFAGDQNDLYKYTSATGAVVSNGTHPYNCAVDERWAFNLFGQRVVATDFESPIQSYLLQSSTAFSDLANGGITALTLVAGSGYTNGTFALTATGGTGFAGTVTVAGGSLTSYTITNQGKGYPQATTIAIPGGAGAGTGGSITPTIATIAPKGRYMATVKGFLCVANTNDGVSGNQPQRVWWSSQNDPTTWPTPGGTLAATLQSSYNDLFGEGGFIKGIVGNLGNADGAIIMEHAIWRMVYVGPPVVFDFFPVEGARGTEAPGSIAQLGGIVYYLGEDGFYSFDGSASNPIGFDKVDKTFFADLDQTHISRVTAAIDPVNKLYIVAYPGSGNVNGNPNHMLAYHWPTQKWAILDENMEYIFRGLAFSNDILDNIGAVSLDSAQYNTFPMDSLVWLGGQLLLAGFDTSNQLSFFNGAQMAATIETSESQPFPDRITFVQDARPIVDGGIPTVAFATRNRLVDPPVYNAATAMNQLGTCPQTINGRYMRAQVNIPAGSNWQHFQGVEVNGIPNGVM